MRFVLSNWKLADMWNLWELSPVSDWVGGKAPLTAPRCFVSFLMYQTECDPDAEQTGG